MAVKPITGMLRRGLVLDLSVAFGMHAPLSLRARARVRKPPADGGAVREGWNRRVGERGARLDLLTLFGEEEGECEEGTCWCLRWRIGSTTTDRSERFRLANANIPTGLGTASGYFWWYGT
jgi:hypothetical protein